MKPTEPSKETPSFSADTLPIALEPDANEDLLAEWHSVYEGLDEEDIAEIEAIVLNRDNWRAGE